jgi:sulfite reductase beta subunit-like hemoprotein
VERRAGFPLGPARAFRFDHNGDRFGWVDAGHDLQHLTLRIPSGRIVDGALDGRGTPCSTSPACARSRGCCRQKAATPSSA